MGKVFRISPPYIHINELLLHITGMWVKNGKTPFKNPLQGGYGEGVPDTE
jgi:hypothetical protein